MIAPAIDRALRLVAPTGTRRQGLAAAVAALLLPLPGQARHRAGKPGGCIPVGRRCGMGKRKKSRPCGSCCSRHATSSGGKARCTCRPDGFNCDHSSQCCNGECVAGSCAAPCIALRDRCNPIIDTCCASGAVCQELGPSSRAVCCFPFGFPCADSAACCDGNCTPQRRCGDPAPAA